MMRRCTIWALVPAITSVVAFRDTSPFFLFSTSDLQFQLQPSIASASSISDAVVSQVETCPSDNYIVITQPDLQAADFANKHTAPRLRQLVQGGDAEIRTHLAVQDVVGVIDGEQIGRAIEKTCGAVMLKIDADFIESSEIANKTRTRVLLVDFPALPLDISARQTMIAEHDAFLSSILALLPSPKFTVIYTTTPPNPSAKSSETPNSEAESYQMEDTLFQSPLHLDLKRDLSSTPKKRDSDNGGVDLPDGPLFERYSFLSPSLFMGILVTLILLSILYVGISAVAGLQVTYAAFDKEMGPAAHKKAQ